jgi:hypothetical protein
MRERRWLFTLAVVVLGLILVGGLIRLARFSPGTSYPPYSSLQSGRTGTKVLFEALRTTGKLEVSRDYLPVGEAQLQSAAVFYLGVAPGSLASGDDAFLSKLERIATAGNRVILGFTDERFESKRVKATETEKGLGIRIMPQRGIVIEDAKAWQTLAGGSGFERSFGAGSIVILPDSRRLNNENLAKNGAAGALVPVLIASNRKVVFEEAHLGVIETGSIAGLARRYRLQGLLAGLLVTAVLFIWNRSVAFPPASRFERETDAVVAGGDRRLIFASLLARHIAPDSLIDVCVSEWNRVRPETQAKRPIDNRPRVGNPPHIYREIQKKIVKL